MKIDRSSFGSMHHNASIHHVMISNASKLLLIHGICVQSCIFKLIIKEPLINTGMEYNINFLIGFIGMPSIRDSVIRLYSSILNIIDLKIYDDGKGFDLESANTGLGIRNMKQRIGLLGGSICWDTSVYGSKINIQLPINDDKYEN